MFIGSKSEQLYNIKLDWRSYQLILFNIIQNAIKYNHPEGDLVVLLSCQPSSLTMENMSLNSNNDELDFIFKTEVIDSGIGITQSRQNMLFVPFLELKMKQNLDKVQDYNIGMGLACSQIITKELGGHLSIKSSEPGLTIFSFELPVKATTLQDKSVQHKSQKGFEILQEFESQKQSKVRQYVVQQDIEKIQKIHMKMQNIDDKSIHNLAIRNSAIAVKSIKQVMLSNKNLSLDSNKINVKRKHTI